MSDQSSNQRERPALPIARVPHVVSNSTRTAPWIARLAARGQFGRSVLSATLTRQSVPISAAGSLLSRVLQRHTQRLLRVPLGGMPLIARLQRIGDDEQAVDERVADGWPRQTSIARVALPQLASTRTLAQASRAASRAMPTIARTIRVASDGAQVADVGLSSSIDRIADTSVPPRSDGPTRTPFAVLSPLLQRSPALVRRAADEQYGVSSIPPSPSAAVSAVFSNTELGYNKQGFQRRGEATNPLALGVSAPSGIAQRTASEQTLISPNAWSTLGYEDVTLRALPPIGSAMQRRELQRTTSVAASQHAFSSLTLNNQGRVASAPQALLSRLISRSADARAMTRAVSTEGTALTMLAPSRVSAPMLIHGVAVPPTDRATFTDAKPARVIAPVAVTAPTLSQVANYEIAGATDQLAAHSSALGSIQRNVSNSVLLLRTFSPASARAESQPTSEVSSSASFQRDGTPSQTPLSLEQPASARRSDASRSLLQSLQSSFVPMFGVLHRTPGSDTPFIDGPEAVTRSQRAPYVSRMRVSSALPLVQRSAIAANALDATTGITAVTALQGYSSAIALPPADAAQRATPLTQRAPLSPFNVALQATPVQEQPRGTGTYPRTPERTAFAQSASFVAQRSGYPLIARTAYSANEGPTNSAELPSRALDGTRFTQAARQVGPQRTLPTISRSTQFRDSALAMLQRVPAIDPQRSISGAAQSHVLRRFAQASFAPAQPALLQRVIMPQQANEVAKRFRAGAGTTSSAATLLQPIRLLRGAPESGAGAVSDNVRPAMGVIARSAFAGFPLEQRQTTPDNARPAGLAYLDQRASSRNVARADATIARTTLPFIQRRVRDAAAQSEAAFSTAMLLPLMQPIQRLPHDSSVQSRAELSPASMPLVIQRLESTTSMAVARLPATASIQRSVADTDAPHAGANYSLIRALASNPPLVAGKQPFTLSSSASIARHAPSTTFALIARSATPLSLQMQQRTAPTGAFTGSANAPTAETARLLPMLVQRSIVGAADDNAALPLRRAPITEQRWQPPMTSAAVLRFAQPIVDQPRARESAASASNIDLRALDAITTAPDSNALQRVPNLFAGPIALRGQRIQRAEQPTPIASLPIAQRIVQSPMIARTTQLTEQSQLATVVAFAPIQNRATASLQPLVQRTALLPGDVQRRALASDEQSAPRPETLSREQRPPVVQSYGSQTIAPNAVASNQRSALTPLLRAAQPQVEHPLSPSLAADMPFIARTPFPRLGAVSDSTTVQRAEPPFIDRASRPSAAIDAASSTGNIQNIRSQPNVFGLISRLQPTTSSASSSARSSLTQPIIARFSGPSAAQTAEQMGPTLARSSTLLALQRLSQSSQAVSTQLPLQRVQRSHRAASASTLATEGLTHETIVLQPFVQRRSNNEGTAALFGGSVAIPARPSLVQRAQSRAEGAPAASRVAPLANNAEPSAPLIANIQRSSAAYRAPLQSATYRFIDRTAETYPTVVQRSTVSLTESTRFGRGGFAAPTQLTQRSVQRISDSMTGAEARTDGSQASDAGPLLFGRVQRAPIPLRDVDSGLGMVQRLQRTSNATRAPIDRMPGVFVQRTATDAASRSTQRLPITSTHLPLFSTGTTPRESDTRQLSSIEPHFSASARPLSRILARTLETSQGLAMLQRRVSDAQTAHTTGTSAPSTARGFNPLVAGQAPQLNRTGSARGEMPSMLQNAPSAHEARVNRQLSGVFVPLPFISRHVLAEQQDGQSASAQASSAFTFGTSTVDLRQPSAPSESPSVVQRTPMGAVMRPSFAWIARRTDSLASHTGTQAPNTAHSGAPSIAELPLPLLDQAHSSAPLDNHADSARAPLVSAGYQAAAAPMDMLRPQRAVVQRSTADEEAAPSSNDIPPIDTAPAAAPDIEALARQVYARLRQRLMLDAERLGR